MAYLKYFSRLMRNFLDTKHRGMVGWGQLGKEEKAMVKRLVAWVRERREERLARRMEKERLVGFLKVCAAQGYVTRWRGGKEEGM